MKRLACGVLFSMLLVAGPGAAQAPVAPFVQVNGDGWITSNASFDGSAWAARTPSRPAFGLQLGETNDIPFERGTAGATFWAHDAGCPQQFATFGKTCGWKLALAITQFRSLVVGGNGIEIDGLALDPPYGRIASASENGNRRFGITNNIFADWSGVDSAAAPRWFAGFNVSHDRYEIARGMSLALTPLTTIDASGTLSANSVSSRRALQAAPDSFAGRGHLHGGRFAFVFKRPYINVPVCVASSEGTAPLHVRSTPNSCTVMSADPADSSMVNVQITGDPS